MANSAPTWILVFEWAARAVLLLLFALSIWSIAIIIDRRRALKQVEQEAGSDQIRAWISKGEFQSLSSWSSSGSGLKAKLVQTALSAPKNATSVEYAVKGYLTEQRIALSKGLPVLATLGSNAPFIGLFGTVLGIIQAFGALANQQSAMASVMGAISEALIATAVGLFVAIPAVVAYNYFSQRFKTLLAECETIRDTYLSRLPEA